MMTIKKIREIADRIAYLVVTKPGGVDGRDDNDKGGAVTLATFDATEAARKVGSDTRYEVRREIVDTALLQAAIDKLTPLEYLIVEEYIRLQMPQRR